MLDYGCTRLVNPPVASSSAPWPTSIGIEVTGRCQLRCRHCFNESGPERGQELPLALLERTLDEMQNWGVTQVRITGGEPTLYSQLDALFDACARRAIAMTLNTHGVLADATLRRLLEAKVERFIVSLDGLETAHDRMRGVGNYRRAVTTCRALREAERPLTIACHFGRDSIDDLSGLATLAAELGADLKLTPLRPIGRILAQSAELLPGPQDCFDVAKKVMSLRRRYPAIRILTDFDILDEHREPFAVTDAWSACGAGRVMVNIAWSGDIYPCAFFVTPDRRFSAGNLRERTLEAIWRESPVFEPFRVHTKSPACQACAHYRRYCAGGCPAVAHFRLGVLDALDPNCFAHLMNTRP